MSWNHQKKTQQLFLHTYHVRLVTVTILHTCHVRPVPGTNRMQPPKKASAIIPPYLSRPISHWNNFFILATSGQSLERISCNHQKKLTNHSSILATSGLSLERIHLTTSGEKIPVAYPAILSEAKQSSSAMSTTKIESIRRSFQWKQPFITRKLR
jgi:hypothetical protein